MIPISKVNLLITEQKAKAKRKGCELGGQGKECEGTKKGEKKVWWHTRSVLCRPKREKIRITPHRKTGAYVFHRIAKGLQ